MGHTIEEGMITIKVAHCGQTKRTTFKKAELTYESLTDWMVTAFGLQAPLTASPTRLAYRDPEGDVISIDSNDELSEALRLTPENAILSLHLSFPRPRGERWFARMCAEHSMADEAAMALGPQTVTTPASASAAAAASSTGEGAAAVGGDSSPASSAAASDEAAAAAAAAAAQEKAPELGWCERRRAWKAAWKARMAEARATGALPPGGPAAAGFAFDGPHHGPHGGRYHPGMGPHGPHHHPHHGHGRGGMMGGFGGFPHPGMGPRPEFCGRPDFHHAAARSEESPMGAAASEHVAADFGRPEFGRGFHPHHHPDQVGAEYFRPHPHPFHHHAPHSHPWSGFGAMSPACWMMPPCGMPMPFMHPFAGFPAAFAPHPFAPVPAAAPTTAAAAAEPAAHPHPHQHHHHAQHHDESSHFGGFRGGRFDREKCGIKRQLNVLLLLAILVVVFHFVPIGAIVVPILGAAAGATAFCLRRKWRKLHAARKAHWAAHHHAKVNGGDSSPSPSLNVFPAPAAPVAAPSAPAAAPVEAPVRRCHGGRFHGRDFAAAFAAAPSAPVAPSTESAPLEAPVRRCRFQPPAVEIPVAAPANVSIVPPAAPAAASPEPAATDFRQFRNDLQLLQSMGFTDMHRNRKLLHRLGDVNRVVAVLTEAAQ